MINIMLLRLLPLLMKHLLVKLPIFTTLLIKHPIKNYQISIKLCFDEICVALLERAELTKKFRLVRSKLDNKVTLLETELHAIYERGPMCEIKDERESLIVYLEAHVHN